MMNDWICSICLISEDKNCHILEPCNHKFHTKCLIKSLRTCGPKCPYCRGEDITRTEVLPTNIFIEIGIEENMLINDDLERAINRV